MTDEPKDPGLYYPILILTLALTTLQIYSFHNDNPKLLLDGYQFANLFLESFGRMLIASTITIAMLSATLRFIRRRHEREEDNEDP